MTTVFSKHWNVPNMTEKSQASAKTSEFDKLDVDLSDKIKNAITRLKITQQRKRKSKSLKPQNFHARSVKKTTIIIKMQSFVHIVKAGYTVNAMQHQSRSMKGCQVRQMMHLFSVYFVS